MHYDHLAKALRSYYVVVGNRFVFLNGMSLNQLAIEMNDRLDGEIDASIFSKVLNADRLFSPHQIEAFSDILKLNTYHRKWLHFCLYRDQCIENGTEITFDFLHPTDTYYYCKAILKEIHDSMYSGEAQSSLALTEYCIELLEPHIIPESSRKFNKLILLYCKAVYFHARIISSSALPNEVFTRINLDLHRLLRIERQSFFARAYRLTLITNAQYIATNYGKYLTSILGHNVSQLAWEAYTLFPHINSEAIFALRNFLVISEYAHKDQEAFEHVYDIIKKSELDKKEDFAIEIAYKHLHTSMLKISVNNKNKNILSQFKFGEDCEYDNDVYDLSNIRAQLEIMNKLKMNDKTTQKKLKERGLYIAHIKNYVRHEKNILLLTQ
ncbi:hypothetical protein C5B42_00560 [Candidatus Cerribacteria bacterium 'Amazon FNV 2010 28 9']|uniref:Uncharacterized protein n=1 Tax=Candidatus Cerribacteria bacterium 'Amazon FNV 2010 28 9' TaxID=2081795 RepID=A0A317JV70_9BACT|nr:MAG: hypothetical protein C5B42_00560 [Candidatus Cerribacteria bacterium 'Amazon FNV 2010 28 9']